MNALSKLTMSEARLFLREPMGVFFVLAFPSILVGILGAIPAFREPSPELGGVRVIDLYVTISIALVLAMLAVQGTPLVLSTYRERGILRRLSTTPVHPAMLLAAQLVSSMLTALVATAMVLAIGRIVFAVPLPQQFPGFVLALIMAAAALFAIGLFIAAVVPNGKAGNAVGTILFFPVMFFAGLWVPREAMPEVLRRVGDFTPLRGGRPPSPRRWPSGSWGSCAARRKSRSASASWR
jgi:ABC-2 type transport system permease protein